MRLGGQRWYRDPDGCVFLIAASADVTLERAASVRAGLRTDAGRATSQGAKMARQSLRSLRRAFDLSRIASVRVGRDQEHTAVRDRVLSTCLVSVLSHACRQQGAVNAPQPSS